MNLADIVNKAAISLAGNKVNALGVYACLTGANITQWSDNHDHLGIILGVAGLLLSAPATLCGLETALVYNQARSVAGDTARSQKYLAKVLSKSRWIFSYCAEQGAYLAARDTGQLDQFKKTHSEKSRCIIPHF